MTKILFVLNPIAGDIDKDDLEEEVRFFCKQNGFAAHFYRTTGTNDSGELQKVLTEFQPDLAAAIGGDGTVSLVAKLIINSAVALLILPQGSGNGLSKDLGIPQDFFEALQVLRHYQIKAIDTLQVNDQVCIHVCDLGFNALVVKKFDEGEVRGPGTYAWIAMQEFIGYEPQEYSVKVKGKTVFQGKAFMLAATNAKAFGSNASINPHGIMDDGQFEIFILQPFPKSASLGILYQMYTDSIDESEFTHHFCAQEAVVINHTSEPCQIDGEPAAMPETLHFKILPKSLNVVLPQEKLEY